MRPDDRSHFLTMIQPLDPSPRRSWRWRGTERQRDGWPAQYLGRTRVQDYVGGRYYYSDCAREVERWQPARWWRFRASAAARLVAKHPQPSHPPSTHLQEPSGGRFDHHLKLTGQRCKRPLELEARGPRSSVSYRTSLLGVSGSSHSLFTMQKCHREAMQGDPTRPGHHCALSDVEPHPHLAPGGHGHPSLVGAREGPTVAAHCPNQVLRNPSIMVAGALQTPGRLGR
jgi:hypothetical protein